jgi:hypothetical protein
MAHIRSRHVLAVVWALFPAAAIAGTTPFDHLTCSKVKDSMPKAKYTATLTTASGSQSCIVRTPAKLACVATEKSAVTPTPPGGAAVGGSAAGAFLCYKAKCPRPPRTDANVSDQFGQRVVSIRVPQLLCAPANLPSPLPGVTTTTVAPGATTTTTVASNECRFVDGECRGTCAGSGENCRASTGTGSCECRSVACGDSDRPQCNGACSDSNEICVFSVTECSCVTIP